MSYHATGLFGSRQPENSSELPPERPTVPISVATPSVAVPDKRGPMLLALGAVALAAVLLIPTRARRNPRPQTWIKKAIKHPGSLRAWVKRRYGDAGFDSQDRIKASVLKRHYHDPGTLGKRVRLAMTLRRM